MPTLDICGVSVEFPFQPYDSQLVYMEKVILALKDKHNAILESPTGTGKTLCLLCATLAWRKHYQENLDKYGSDPIASDSSARQPLALSYESAAASNRQSSDQDDAAVEGVSLIPRIIYSSRTHSQLKQVIQELKTTSYHPKVAVLGSREHLCVHPKISQLRGTKQNLACRASTKSQKCVFKRGYDSMARRRSKKQATTQLIMDIEELSETMKEKEICPFFTCRSMLPDAEIVFVPYNYLIDPMARRSIGISLENSVLIFDEAHNVESVASDAASYALSNNDLFGCINEVTQFKRALEENRVNVMSSSQLTVESVNTLLALLQEIEAALNGFPVTSTGGFTKSGDFIFEFFQRFNVNFDTCPLVMNLIEEIIDAATQGNDDQRASSKLDAFLSFLSTIFRNKEGHLKVASNYRLHVQEMNQNFSDAPRVFNSSRKNQKTRVLHYWCFHPGVAFREICAQNVYNVILTSGTLSPLETTIKELGIDFPVRLENSHVIDPSQVFVGILNTGVTGKRLNSSYNFRSTEEYLLELGNTIVNFIRMVPNGVLVFFPSYIILEETIQRWQRPSSSESSSSIWDRILNLKEVYVEPRGRAEFKQTVEDYHESIRTNTNGAVFFAVCRGKVSEGIDFSNEKARAVVITGLPFPPSRDPRIVLKKTFLDEAVVNPGEMKLTGNQWYVQQASRAVNQAIGRVIRHRHDYGAILLCDERFALQQQLKCLSKWLQPYCRCCRTYGEAHKGLMCFFKRNKSENQTTTTTTKAPRKTPAPMAPVPTVMPVKAVPSTTNPSMALSVDKTCLSSTTAAGSAIGDGQSYVNPELLAQRSAVGATTSSQVRHSVVSLPQVEHGRSHGATASSALAPSKRTLGAILSASKPVMVNATSAISRPFVPPKPMNSSGTNLNDHMSSNIDGQVSKRLGTCAKSATSAESRKSVAALPVVARRLLSSEEVSKLYEHIRQLETEHDSDATLHDLCVFLQQPERHELLQLLTKVLSTPIASKLVDTAHEFGISIESIETNPRSELAVVATENAANHSAKATAQIGIESFLERLENPTRRKRTREGDPATVIDDPQCFVCYDIPRKAFAASCGHICCGECWKKMERDGFTACPICKNPLKLDQLTLIRAAAKKTL